MKNRILGLMLGFLFFGANLFAADGDLIVNGKIGLGTTSPSTRLHISGTNDATSKLRIERTSSSYGPTLSFYENGSELWAIKTDLDGSGGNKLQFGLTATDSALVTFLQNGNVGIGTTNPGYKLDVLGSLRSGTGSRLATNDFYDGVIELGGAGSGNRYSFIDFHSDDTYTDNGLRILRGNTGANAVSEITHRGTGDLVIQTLEAAAIKMKSSFTDRLTILSNGNIGIGTTNPGANLELRSAAAELRMTDSDTGVYLFQMFDYNNDAILQMRKSDWTVNVHIRANGNSYFNGGNVGIGTTSPSYQLQLSTNLAAKTATNTWIVTSDSRLKTDIQPYTKGLKEILQINPVNYKYNGKGGIGHNKVKGKNPITGEDTETEIVDTELLSKTNVGVIAEDIQAVVPETVSSHKGKINEDDLEETDILDFDSHALTFILINAVKELKAEIDSLNEQIADLKAKVK